MIQVKEIIKTQGLNKIQTLRASHIKLRWNWDMGITYKLYFIDGVTSKMVPAFTDLNDNVERLMQITTVFVFRDHRRLKQR